MEEELKKLNQISNFFKRMNSKLRLLNLIECAKIEYDKYNYSAAKISLQEAYDINAKNPTVLRGLGCVAQFENNFDNAIEYFKKALEFSDKKEVEYTLIGMAYYLQDKLDDALVYFNRAIDENEDYDKAYDSRNQTMLENHLKIIDLQESLKKYF